MPRSPSSETITLPSIQELLPEHFCRPLATLSINEPRPRSNTSPASLGRLTLPSRHLPYHTAPSQHPPSRNSPPRAHATLPQPRTADHNRDDDRRHACPWCPRRFNRPSSLAIHLNTHTGAKRKSDPLDPRAPVCVDTETSDPPCVAAYPCPACGREFSVNSNMRRHYRNHFANGQRSGTLRTPRLGAQQSLDGNTMSTNVNLTPYRYPPLDPPTLSRSTTPSTRSETQYSDSDQDSLASSPQMRPRSEHTLRGSLAARSAEWGGSYGGGQYSMDRIPRSSRSASFPASSLRVVTSPVHR
ncbi:hypothetical protein DAEQUDRAFT_84454 [Daedalea quercina L-15889]|uniref:C2H2-type domain-containing protein n=1 Tax=Daedalea quercina L-15889 TaxID=1314783 RepID=A0A165L3G3_9APHY|nr:hypothetical protein DAEQUDRAFT_84454 [Daedalea quercina L-15889]